MDVVLPCLDEAPALAKVLGAVPAGLRPIVVDNGSTDGSPELARALGARVVLEPRRGYGAACHRGLLAATSDVVAFCDADASVDLHDVLALAQWLSDGRADLLVGRRVAAPGAWPAHARLANAALSLPMSLAARHRLHDLGPVRVARREDLLALGVRDRRSGYPLETVLRAARAGWRVREAPIAYSPRLGRSKVTGTARGTLRAVADMSAVLAYQGWVR
ncbi:glycosyltransferase family 2 protein [Angustibacter luteus]|uniref:Glycosyltransferase family 2 protein n=1 Tax=Angustibacter luteus TaxID=658456 RepID=A0ABW1JBL6_9ACTN